MTQPNSPGALPQSEAVNLKEAIDYQVGSVVSRELASTPAGTITLFAFDKGQGLSEHSAPFDAIVQVLEGRVEFSIGGNKITAEAGQVVVMPADIPHGLSATERFKMLLTMLKA